MTQAPIAPQVTFMQQVMPYLVIFVIGLLGALGLVIKAFATKVVAQLQANHDATAEAATEAKTAVQAVQAHGLAVTGQLDNITQKVDGAMTALTDKSNKQTADALADKDRQIAALTPKRP